MDIRFLDADVRYTGIPSGRTSSFLFGLRDDDPFGFKQIYPFQGIAVAGFFGEQNFCSTSVIFRSAKKSDQICRY